MKKRSLNLNDDLYQYMLDISLREPKEARELREETKRMLASALQSPPEESQFIALLVKLMNCKRILEIGTFTGYTTMLMAMNISEDAKIIACDVDETWTFIGRKYWALAGVEHKIDLRINPAEKTMEQLIDDGFLNYFDFIFIDADKEGYERYFNLAAKLVKLNGIIAVDNVFWNGSVINEINQSPDVRAIRSLNQTILRDKRYSISTLPIGDGLTLAMRVSDSE